MRDEERDLLIWDRLMEEIGESPKYHVYEAILKHIEKLKTRNDALLRRNSNLIGRLISFAKKRNEIISKFCMEHDGYEDCTEEMATLRGEVDSAQKTVSEWEKLYWHNTKTISDLYEQVENAKKAGFEWKELCQDMFDDDIRLRKQLHEAHEVISSLKSDKAVADIRWLRNRLQENSAEADKALSSLKRNTSKMICDLHEQIKKMEVRLANCAHWANPERYICTISALANIREEALGNA